MPKPFDESGAPADPSPASSDNAPSAPKPEIPRVAPALKVISYGAPAVAPRLIFLDPPHVRVSPSAPSAPMHAPIPPSLDSLEEMPANLRNQLADLEAWAVANQRDARNDAIRFWVLKIPAIIASASAGIFAFYEWEVVPLIAGAVASACVLIDGLNPGGALKNAHYKAFFEIRELEVAMQAEWRIESYKATTPTEKNALGSSIIRNAERKRGKIAEELKKAETALAKA